MFCISKSYHCMCVLHYKSSCNNLWSSFKLTNESSIIIRKSHSIFWNNISLGFHILFFWFYIVNKCQRVLNLRSVRKPTANWPCLHCFAPWGAMSSRRRRRRQSSPISKWSASQATTPVDRTPSEVFAWSSSLIHWRVAWRICTVFTDGVGGVSITGS